MQIGSIGFRLALVTGGFQRRVTMAAVIRKLSRVNLRLINLVMVESPIS